MLEALVYISGTNAVYDIHTDIFVVNIAIILIYVQVKSTYEVTEKNAEALTYNVQAKIETPSGFYKPNVRNFLYFIIFKYGPTLRLDITTINRFSLE